MLSKTPSKDKEDFNWKKELSLSWSLALSNMLESEYGNNLATFIEQVYLSDKEVYPIKNRLFNPFQHCLLEDVKIVIIDNNPVKDKRSSGIGRGIIEKSSPIKDLPVELRQFRDCIYSTIYGNQYSITNFDNSLDDYCSNDMLFLNCSMCVEKDKDYTIIWKNFIRNVIQEINKRNNNVVYLFLTGDNLYLRNHIDEDNNKVIINPFNTLMDYSTVFLELDEYVEDNYPPYNRVVW
jgi:uracil-DNA glycosylase